MRVLKYAAQPKARQATAGWLGRGRLFVGLAAAIAAVALALLPPHDTLAQTPSVTAVTVSETTQTSFTVAVDLANPSSASLTVHLRYRAEGTDPWTTAPSESTSTTSATFTVSSLTSGTTYDVEASLDNGFASGVVALPVATQPPKVTAISQRGLAHQTRMSFDVTIQEPNGARQYVFARYRVTPSGQWTYHRTHSSTDEASVLLYGLTSNTGYEVEASIDLSFPADATASTTFDTLPPYLEGVRVDDSGQTAATVTIDIGAPNGEAQTVYLQYRKQADVTWTDASAVVTRTATGEVSLTGLSTDTTYDVQASLDDTFPQGETVSGTFTTAPPLVTDVSVDNIAQTTADVTVTLDEPNGESQVVNLQYYRTRQYPLEYLTDSLTTATDTGTTTLTGLLPGESYNVQASLDSQFPGDASESEEFETLHTPASLTNVSVVAVSTSATHIRGTVANAQSGTRMHLRYRQSPDGPWSSTRSGSGGLSIWDVRLTSLSAETAYEAEMSLDATFPPGETQSTTFTSLQATPSLQQLSIGSGSITQTGATVTVTIADPQGTETVYLQHRELPSGSWGSLQTDTTSTSTVDFTLSGLTPGTHMQVRASQTNTFPGNDTLSERFVSAPPDPAIVELFPSAQGTEISVGVRIQNLISRLPVYLRYRTTPSDPWSSTQQVLTLANDAVLEALLVIRGLTPGTDYDVEVSLDNSFPPSETSPETITTLAPLVSSVRLQRTLENSATIAGNIQFADGREVAVYSRYREVGDTDWLDGPTAISTTASFAMEVTPLLGGVTYEVQVSTLSDLDSGSLPVTFTTRPARIVSVGIYSLTQTEASHINHLAGVSSENVREFYTRYRNTSPLGPWIRLLPSPPPPPFDPPLLLELAVQIVETVEGLSQETGYEISVSLDSDFTPNTTKSVRFTTLWATVSAVEAVDVTQDSATLNLTLEHTDGSNRAVYVRYRPAGSEARWSSGPTTRTATDTATLLLRRIRAGAEYEVEVSTYNSFPSYATETVSVTTLPATIVGFEVKSANQTEAEVNVDYEGHSLYVVNTYYRFRTESPTGPWSQTYVEVGTTRSSKTRLVHKLPHFMSGNQYQLEASTDPTFPTQGTLRDTFETAPPTLFSMQVGGITATEATVTVNLAAPNGAAQTVYVQYRQRGEQSWIDLPDIVTTTGTGEHRLTGLLALGVYEVRASMDDTFPSGETVTAQVQTEPPGVASFTADNITKNGADLTLTLSDPIARAQSFNIELIDIPIPRAIRARVKLTVSDNTGTAKVSGLLPDTGYIVIGRYDSPELRFVRLGLNFDTLPPDPRVSLAYVDSTTSNSAEVKVDVADRHDRSPTVYLRHRAPGQPSWVTTPDRNATSDEVVFPLAGLDVAVRYDVEVSLDDTFPSGGTTRLSLTTLQASPTLSGLTLGSITQTTAEATVSIASPSGTQRVYLRHRQLPNGRWSSAQSEDTDTGTAEFSLTGLAMGRKYQVEASLSSSFPATDTRPRVMETLPPDPSVSRIQILTIDGFDFTMDIIFAHGGAETKTAYLRYRIAGEREWNSNVFEATTTDEEKVEMQPTGLEPDTLYEFEASLESTFPRGATASTTIRSEPAKVIGIDVDTITEGTVDLTTKVKFAAPEDQPVNTRYRTLPAGSWVSAPTVTLDNPDRNVESTVAYTVSGLTAGMDYEIEADTDTGFRRAHRRTFTTLVPTPTGVHVHEKSERKVVVSVSSKDRRESVTMYTRYRSGTDPWNTRSPVDAPSGHFHEFELNGLAPDEEYELQASLERDFPGQTTKSFMFTTLGEDPSSESLTETGVTKDSAKAKVKVHSPDGTEQMVHMRCRELGESGWTPMDPEMTTNQEVTFDLTNLKEDTLYEIQAALNSAFDAESALSRVFNTRGGSSTSSTTGGGGGGGGGGGFGPAPKAPKFADGFRATRDLPENARPGEAVGGPIQATHVDDLAITYSLSGTDAASFTVDEETGQIRVKEGVDLVLGRTYTVNLTATDSAGFGAIIIVTIEVSEAAHHAYDANRNGTIEREEVVAAVKDYFAGLLAKEDVIELVKLYFGVPV